GPGRRRSGARQPAGARDDDAARAARRARPVPVHRHRLSAVARPLDPQHAHRRRQRPHPDPVRVLRPRGPLAALEHRETGAAELQSRARDRRRAADDVRRAAQPVEAGRRRGEGIFRVADVQHHDPAQRAARRGAELRKADPLVRCAVGGRAELPRGGPGVDPPRRARRRGAAPPLPCPTREEAEREGSLVELAIADIRPNPYQPRRDVDPAALEELTASIRKAGLLQPVVVRQAPGNNGGFELIAGERRLRACQALGWEKIPAVKREVDDRTVLTLALVENLQRDDLSPVDEARGYERLIAEFNLTQQDVADAVGRDRSTVANALRLLKLPAAVL